MKWIIVLLLAHSPSENPASRFPEFFNSKVECEQARAFADKFEPMIWALKNLQPTKQYPFRSECRLEDVI